MNKVEELVEWVAQKIYEAHYSLTLWDDLHEHNKTGWRREAKQILSHPDLALIDRERDYPEGVFDYEQHRRIFEDANCLPVIPLKEALEFKSVD